MVAFFEFVLPIIFVYDNFKIFILFNNIFLFKLRLKRIDVICKSKINIIITPSIWWSIYRNRTLRQRSIDLIWILIMRGHRRWIIQNITWMIIILSHVIILLSLAINYYLNIFEIVIIVVARQLFLIMYDMRRRSLNIL